MAFNHENPNVNYEMGAWDYYINEVKTFNERLESYQEEVNQKLSDQDEEIATFKTNVNNQIGTLRIQLADFERDINATFSQWTEDQEEIFNQELAAFRAEIRAISDNIESYVAAHMSEWQVEASTITFTANTVSGLSYTNISCDKTYSEIVDLLSEPAVDILFTYTGRSFKVVSITRKTTSIVFRFRGYADLGNDTINCTFEVEIDTDNEITCTLTDGHIIRTYTKAVSVAPQETETAIFDNHAKGILNYTILEYGQTFQNQKWVGSQYNSGVMCLPYLTDNSDSTNISLSMRVYNPNMSGGSIDITAYAKVLLELP